MKDDLEREISVELHLSFNQSFRPYVSAVKLACPPSHHFFPEERKRVEKNERGTPNSKNGSGELRTVKFSCQQKWWKRRDEKPEEREETASIAVYWTQARGDLQD